MRIATFADENWTSFSGQPHLIVSKMKDRIYQFMKQQGMSQKQFASELCVAEATLSSIFTGRTRPTNALISAIHERFPEVSIPWLMFGEGDMFVGETVKETSAPAPLSSPQGDMFASSSPSAQVLDTAIPPTSTPSPAPILRETIKYIDKPQRKITEIRVFFDDGTYETFSANWRVLIISAPNLTPLRGTPHRPALHAASS